MIFQHTLQQVLDGTKIQTSRVVKPLDNFMRVELSGGSVHYVRRNNRLLWQVGNTYAVQPGRGKRSVARIRILKIRMMDIREFTVDDIIAEGFGGGFAFLKLWVEMHDKPLHRFIGERTLTFTELIEWVLHQPAICYNAWVLGFELVR